MENPLMQRDVLTGLLSRRGLEAVLQEHDALETTDLTLFSVLISRFGSINSSMGGALADKVIAMTARRLQKVFPHALQVARTHGDHFCLLFAELDSVDDTIERLNDFTRRPLAIGGEVIVLSVRIGIARMGPSLQSAGLLLNGSEIALHTAKKLQIKTSFYEIEMEELARQTHRLENDLRVSLVSRHVELHRAMANDEFHVYYQPIVDCRTGQIHSFEALMRWVHPEKGLIPPAQFIPIAEQIQVIDVLGSWIIQKAIADAATWPVPADGARIGVSVNISPSQFNEPAILLNAISQALKDTQLEPSLVTIEITESSAMVDKMGTTLQQVKNMGCQIALDDFGTGYSSLTQLHQMPLGYLKLDRSFIKDLDSEVSAKAIRSQRLTQAILSLAEAFGIKAVVEGVETQHQFDEVRRIGAYLIQGYLYSKPLPSTEIHEYIGAFNGERRNEPTL